MVDWNIVGSPSSLAQTQGGGTLPAPVQTSGNSGMSDLINATKGQAINTGAIAQSIDNLITVIKNQSTSSFASNGYFQFSSGLLLQWGTGSTTSGSGTITFQKTFPANCWVVLLTITGSAIATDNALIASSSPSTSTPACMTKRSSTSRSS